MSRRLTRGTSAVTAGVLLALALTATPLRADLGGPAEQSWSRVLRYAGCALGIAAASSGLGLAAALVGCAYIISLET